MAAMMTVTNPGDKVIIFSPFYENYGADTILSGAEPIYVPLVPPDFHFDANVLEDAFRQHPKAIILCNPSNPCGKVFTREELEMLASNGARIIGINARNLSTFDTSLDRVAELIQRVPERCVAVGESAIRERADLLRLHELGADAFLIGETLMRAPSPGRKLCELLSK